mmetsp:Transcript_51928/g.101698  ORF Transcript_51928/g.101698 Transcript_51928/m.101698 type:complete len:283 (+) Transcript_51928:2038-2886(+)
MMPLEGGRVEMVVAGTSDGRIHLCILGEERRSFTNIEQCIKLDSEVRGLTRGGTGSFCIAGTESGTLAVLGQAEDSAKSLLKLTLKLRTWGCKGAITQVLCMPSKEAEDPNAHMLLVSSADSSCTIFDCVYEPSPTELRGPGICRSRTEVSHSSSIDRGRSLTGHTRPPLTELNRLQIRLRVKVASSLLPVRCCYSGDAVRGASYLISATQDKAVLVHALEKEKGGGFRSGVLAHHEHPVVSVTVNTSETVLATGDTQGKICLWRGYNCVASLEESRPCELS